MIPCFRVKGIGIIKCSKKHLIVRSDGFCPVDYFFHSAPFCIHTGAYSFDMGSIKGHVLMSSPNM